MIGAQIYDLGVNVSSDTKTIQCCDTAFFSTVQSPPSSPVQSTPTNDQQFNDQAPRRTRFATVYADGKAKRYSTRRSSAWKAVSRRITTFQGSGYMDFEK